jgi:hypothetical protein
MAAETRATGARSWLQAQHITWLTPPRLRAATILLFIAAFGFSSITLTGSTPAAPHHSHHQPCTHPDRYQPGFEPHGTAPRCFLPALRTTVSIVVDHLRGSD